MKSKLPLIMLRICMVSFKHVYLCLNQILIIPMLPPETT
jgi:hypothetical protein